jgi:antitoxin component YwqK of YwqJK toxin-antitoxin module
MNIFDFDPVYTIVSYLEFTIDIYNFASTCKEYYIKFPNAKFGLSHDFEMFNNGNRSILDNDGSGKYKYDHEMYFVKKGFIHGQYHMKQNNQAETTILAHYNKGTLNGEYINSYKLANGNQLIEYYLYSSGNLDSTGIVFNGNNTFTIANYKDNLYIGECLCYDMSHESNLINIDKYLDINNRSMIISFKSRFKPCIKCPYNDKGEKHGEYVELFHNDTIKAHCSYINNIPVGKYIEYYNETQIKKIIDHNDNGKFIVYYINGKVEKYGDNKEHYTLGSDGLLDSKQIIIDTDHTVTYYYDFIEGQYKNMYSVVKKNDETLVYNGYGELIEHM